MTDPVVGHVDAEGYDGPVTAVVRRRVAPGSRADFEAWLDRVTPVIRGFPGHLSLLVLRPSPGDDEYVVLIRFATVDDLRRWEQADVRADLLDELTDLTVQPLSWEEQAGAATWLTLTGEAPRGGPPPRWKQAVVTTLGLVPLLLLNTVTLGRLVDAWPWWLQIVVVTPILVAFMAYGIVPALTRLLAPWLRADSTAPPRPGHGNAGGPA